jgi:ABC-2 type transport system permease protein
MPLSRLPRRRVPAGAPAAIAIGGRIHGADRIMCTALGTAVGSVLQDMQGFQLIINFIVLPLFFFSSALFPVPDLPGVVRLVVRLNPLSYGVDGLRGALDGGFAFGVATDFAVLGSLGKRQG